MVAWHFTTQLWYMICSKPPCPTYERNLFIPTRKLFRVPAPSWNICEKSIVRFWNVAREHWKFTNNVKARIFSKAKFAFRVPRWTHVPEVPVPSTVASDCATICSIFAMVWEGNNSLLQSRIDFQFEQTKSHSKEVFYRSVKLHRLMKMVLKDTLNLNLQHLLTLKDNSKFSEPQIIIPSSYAPSS